MHGYQHRRVRNLQTARTRRNDLTEKQWQARTARQKSEVVKDGQHKELYTYEQWSFIFFRNYAVRFTHRRAYLKKNEKLTATINKDVKIGIKPRTFLIFFTNYQKHEMCFKNLITSKHC